jgi:hypothetical protein
MQSISTILPVLGLSTLISFGIKYVAPQLTIPATDQVALILVLLPTIVIAALLLLKTPRREP